MERENAKRVLAGQGWLSRLPEADRNAVLDRSVLRKFRKGEAIYALEGPVGGMYGLASGTLAIGLASTGRQLHVVHYGRPGLWFGEAAIITGEPRRVDVVARADASLLHLPQAAIAQLLSTDPAFWRHIALAAVLNLDLSFRTIKDFTIHDPAARIISVLLRLAGDPPAASTGPARIETSQADLADIAGLSRAFVSRELGRMSKERALAVGYGFVEVLDVSSLRRQLSQKRSKAKG